MEVKILTLIVSFVLYQTVVLQVIESPVSNGNDHFNAPFNNIHWHPHHHHRNRPLSTVFPGQNINWQNWIPSFPNRFPFNNNRLNSRPMPFNRPMHHHMINMPNHSQLGTSIVEEYLNRLNRPNQSMTTKPDINGNMNKPTNWWYQPHGTESSVGVLNRPSNKPYQSQPTESYISVLSPTSPTNTNQAVDMMNHNHHDNTDISNSTPPKEIQEDPISDDSSPDIDIRGGFDG